MLDLHTCVRVPFLKVIDRVSQYYTYWKKINASIRESRWLTEDFIARELCAKQSKANAHLAYFIWSEDSDVNELAHEILACGLATAVCSWRSGPTQLASIEKEAFAPAMPSAGFPIAKEKNQAAVPNEVFFS